MTSQADLAQMLEYIKVAFDVHKYDEVLRLCDKALTPTLSDHRYFDLVYYKALAYKEQNEWELSLEELRRGLDKIKNIELAERRHRGSAKGLGRRKAYYQSLYYALQSNLYIKLDGCLSERALIAIYKSGCYDQTQRAASFIFDIYGKEGVFEAIKTLPRITKIPLLNVCLNPNSLLGQQFYQQRGVKACQPNKGVLEEISEYLKKLKAWGPRKWECEGDQALVIADYPSALEAYREAEAICKSENSARLKLNCGNISLMLGRYDEAYTYYEAVLKQEPVNSEQYIDALNNHVNGMIADARCTIADVIMRLEEINVICVENNIEMNNEQKKMLEEGIAALFSKHGKLAIFEAIKGLGEEQSKALLTKCLEKGHYLGKHFWKNRIPGTNCGLHKGTLGKIKRYLDELNGVEKLPASPFSLRNFFSRSKPNVESTEMDLVNRPSISI